MVPKPAYYGKRPSPSAHPAKNMPTGSGKYSISGGLSGKTITIDPGHGGSDSGAVGPHGVQEKILHYRFLCTLKKALENRGAKVLMTRTTDVDVYGPNASGVDELGCSC